MIPFTQDTLTKVGQYVEEEAQKTIQEKDLKNVKQAINKQLNLVERLFDSSNVFLKVQIENAKEEDWISQAWWDRLLASNSQHLVDNLSMWLELESDANKIGRLARLLIFLSKNFSLQCQKLFRRLR